MMKPARPHPSLEVTRTRNQTINWSGLIGHLRSLNNTVCKTFTVLLNENKKVVTELKFAGS